MPKRGMGTIIIQFYTPLHQDSQILFSACPCDNRVIAWDVTRDSAATPLQAITGGGVSLLSFAPDGRRLLTGTPAAEFRVWDAGELRNQANTIRNYLYFVL
jgi:WD40 repeat protein